MVVVLRPRVAGIRQGLVRGPVGGPEESDEAGPLSAALGAAVPRTHGRNLERGLAFLQPWIEEVPREWMILHTAPPVSWPPSSTRSTGGCWVLVRRPLQFRQALGDVDVQVLDVDVELLRGFQSGRSLAR